MLAVGGCRTQETGDADPRPPAGEPRFFSGIQAHQALCTDCHDPAHEPGHFTDTEWQQFLPKHIKSLRRSKKIKIDDQSAEMILEYLTKYN